MRKADYALSREKTQWNARIREVWDRVRFVEAGPGPSGSMVSGRAVAVRAAIDLAGLAPTDVRAEVVIGRVDSNGHLEETEVVVLPFLEQQGTAAVFAKDIIPERTGRLGYALRVSPNHYDDPLTRPCASLMKWSSGGVNGSTGVHSMSVRGTYVFEAEAGSGLLFAEPSESPSSPSGNPTTQLLPRGLSCGLVGAIGI